MTPSRLPQTLTQALLASAAMLFACTVHAQEQRQIAPNYLAKPIRFIVKGTDSISSRARWPPN